MNYTARFNASIKTFVVLACSVLIAVALVAPSAAQAQTNRSTTFAVTADTTPGVIPSKHEKDPYLVVEQLKAQKSQWDNVLVVGDLVHGNSEDVLWNTYWHPTYGTLAKTYGQCRLWSLPGNHEWNWNGTRPNYYRNYKQHRAEWQRCDSYNSEGNLRAVGQVYGNTQFVKRVPGWLVVGLDSEQCSQPADLLRFARNVADRENRSIMLAHHRPFYNPDRSFYTVPPWTCDAVFQQVRNDKRIKLSVSGHYHDTYKKSFRPGYVQYIAGIGGGHTETIPRGQGTLGWLNVTLKSGGSYDARWNIVRR